MNTLQGGLTSSARSVNATRMPYTYVPGNHDVDQQVVSQNPLLRDAQQAVRLAGDNPERNTALRQRLTDASAQALFYSPLSEFNEFAGRYGCSFFADASSYAWEARPANERRFSLATEGPKLGSFVRPRRPEGEPVPR